jgi:hypothetical protein
MSHKQTKNAWPPEKKRTRGTAPEQKSFYDRRPVWSFSRCHFDHPRWGEAIMDRKLHIFNNLYSLAMSNMERLYGVIIDGVFFLIWYDPEHEIYPVGKRHT